MFRLPFLLAMLAVATVVACDGPGTLESPLEPQFAAAADSAEGPRVTLAQAVAGLPVQLGDVVVCEFRKFCPPFFRKFWHQGSPQLT